MTMRRLTVLALIILLNIIYNSIAIPLNLLENPKVPSSKVLDFLKKFGYIEEDDSSSGALYTEEGITDIIKNVQKFGALEQTGKLNNNTLKLMSSPRCGVPDIIKKKRQKRYAFGSEGWKKRTITYFVANWSPKLGESSVTKNIQLALDTWGRYGRLKFQRSSTPNADIIVAFGSGYHGDNYPFDGMGNILAHAFFPYEEQGFGGDIHFDADENWTDRRKGGNEDGMDFLTVALHELGHSLGLSHSVVPNSVMFPYYQGYDPNTPIQLGYDDILGMYELYIRRNIQDDTYITSTDKNYDDKYTEATTLKTTTTTKGYVTLSRSTVTTDRSTTHITTTYDTSYSGTTKIGSDQDRHSSDIFPTRTTTSVTFIGDTESVEVHKEHDSKHNIPTTNSPSLPNICEGRFDAVATLREEIFIFKEQYVWRLKEVAKIESGYPILINQMFLELPKTIKQIDAAYERPDGMIVLFTGNRYWVYDGKSFIENSPRAILEYGLPPDLDKIDAIQVWARNDKTYMYRQDRFWRYNETAKKMDEGYPKHMERWRGVPHNLDSATTWRGETYFFKDEFYWKFDNDWIIVTEQSPLPAPQIWLGCPEDDRTLSRLFVEDY